MRPPRIQVWGRVWLPAEGAARGVALHTLARVPPNMQRRVQCAGPTHGHGVHPTVPQGLPGWPCDTNTMVGGRGVPSPPSPLTGHTYRHTRGRNRVGTGRDTHKAAAPPLRPPMSDVPGQPGVAAGPAVPSLPQWSQAPRRRCPRCHCRVLGLGQPEGGCPAAWGACDLACAGQAPVPPSLHWIQSPPAQRRPWVGPLPPHSHPHSCGPGGVAPAPVVVHAAVVVQAECRCCHCPCRP